LNQRYSIKFISSEEDSQMKSGNPGYIVGLPMLIGQDDSSTQGILAYEGGFQLKGADFEGACMTSVATKDYDYGDPVVTFGEDLTYGCALKMNKEQLKNYCGATTQFLDYPIFTNLNFW
jgi:Protein of unknown function (DUF1619)